MAVDIRRGSPHFGKWIGVELSGENKHLLYVPPGFAHGFQVLSDTAEVMYKCTDEYSPADDRGIIWNDPDINIAWPLPDPLLSGKDRLHPAASATATTISRSEATMRYLITGKNGQLAQAFIQRFEKEGIEYQAPEESELDITNASAVDQAVAAWKPDVIINCAAYNLVDKAEQEKDKVFAVNATGPGHLARAAARQKAMIVHFGSDYVFDGRKENGLYTETDAVNPLERVREEQTGRRRGSVLPRMHRHLVFRFSWVFGAGTQNFIYKLQAWAEKNEYLKIACDEFSVPTSTGTVVDVTLRSLEQGLTGRFHLTNSGYCSRYEWAKVVFSCERVSTSSSGLFPWTPSLCRPNARGSRP